MATLVRWDPVRELAAWQNDIERLMGTFLRGAPPAPTASVGRRRSTSGRPTTSWSTRSTCPESPRT